jgi:hypothetical protein
MNRSRKFGQWRVTVEGTSISIIGDWYSNWGSFYPHMFDRFKRGEDVQIYGMESSQGLTKRVRDYLISLV